MSRSLSTLAPEFRERLEVLLEACAARGVDMRPYCTERPPSDQARLWRQSRCMSEIDAAARMLMDADAHWLAGVLLSVGPQHGPQVTSALPGQSWHQFGLACDSYWLASGKAQWSAAKGGNANGYRVMAEEASRLGLRSLGDIGDWPHVQGPASASPRSDGMTWAEIDEAMRERFGGS